VNAENFAVKTRSFCYRCKRYDDAAAGPSMCNYEVHDLVYGVINPVNSPCYHERSIDGRCQPQGRNFEEKGEADVSLTAKEIYIIMENEFPTRNGEPTEEYIAWLEKSAEHFMFHSREKSAAQIRYGQKEDGGSNVQKV